MLVGQMSGEIRMATSEAIHLQIVTISSVFPLIKAHMIQNQNKLILSSICAQDKYATAAQLITPNLTAFVSRSLFVFLILSTL